MERYGYHMKVKNYVGIMIVIVLLFLAHRSVPFMMDDNWYSTNLATGEELQSVSDVLEGQVWHYFNWGGRSITHGILQLTLMTGEYCADILNVCMTLLLAYMVCVVAGQRKTETCLAALSLIISLNANVRMSMFWQSGLVNYVYSTAWILLFLWPYLRVADEPDCRELPFISLWILPLGIMTGWSNENMGPACFVLAVLVTGYRRLIQKKRAALWMYLGVITSLAGSVMVILAPGNFVRSAAIEKKGLTVTLLERSFSMLQAGMDFLFPTLMFVVLMLFIVVVQLKQGLRMSQLLLLAGMVLSYGAMVLSPHYPDRATFGTMVLGIILIITLLEMLLKHLPKMKKYSSFIQLCIFGCAVLRLLELIV